jgi:K+-sensing histidine kinase KdpD
MKKIRFPFTPKQAVNSLLAVLTVAATTVPLLLIGRDTLGEAVIALLYLLPVVWSAYRWGQLPGISAALTAALTFDFLFIPPFYTFAVARLEGWVVLAIFLFVAVVVVGRIQASISKAREATFMYELSAALSGVRTQDEVARTLTRHVQQLFQASLVRVYYQRGDTGSSSVMSQPEGAERETQPDRTIPILNSRGLVGEVQIWRGAFIELPLEESALLQNFATQASRAFERIQRMGIETTVKSGTKWPGKSKLL